MLLTKRKTKNSRKRHSVLFLALSLIAIVLTGFLGTAKAELATLNPEDWMLEVILFDMGVNNGYTPLTNVDWTINTSERNEVFDRQITMQVNYRNESVDRTYGVDELEIKINNPFYDSLDYLIKRQMVISANGSGETTYNWHLVGDQGETITVRNSVPIEEKTNTEGSIQITFALTSDVENEAEYFLDSCTKEFNVSVRAKMNDVVESNTASIHFKRVYNHPWDRYEYGIIEEAEKIDSFEGLGDNADDYTWVRYKVRVRTLGYETMYYTRSNSVVNGLDNTIGISKNYEIKTQFPTGLAFKSSVGRDIAQDADGYITVNQEDTNYYGYAGNYNCNSSIVECWGVYVGYPKDVYNTAAGNLNISNEMTLFGTYDDRDYQEELDTSNISLNLADYEYELVGPTLSVGKGFCGATNSPYDCNNNYPLYYQEIIKEGATAEYRLNMNNKYGGQKYDLKIGDDLVYYLDENDNPVRLIDYYFDSVGIPTLRDWNGNSIANDKYAFSLYVRRGNDTSYSKYGDYDRTAQTINFTEEDNVKAWYILFKDVTQGIKVSAIPLNMTIKTTSGQLPESADYYNYVFGEVLVNGEPNYSVVEDDYNRLMFGDVISANDMATYGRYMLRSAARARWEPNVFPEYKRVAKVEVGANTRNVSYNAVDEKFYGYYTLSGELKEAPNEIGDAFYEDDELNAQSIPDENWVRSVDFYDLLPLGVEVNEAGWNQAITTNSYCSIMPLFDQSGNAYFTSVSECRDYYNAHTTHTVIKNWHNTGRTYVHIKVDFSERPFSSIDKNSNYDFPFIILPYSVSYDAYREYGRIYENRAYLEISNTTKTNSVLDNGELDVDAIDLDGDGLTDDVFSTAAYTINLVSATSTAQDLQASVDSGNQHEYNIGQVLSDHDEEYEYKLRVRTGPNRTTNVVLYDHIEEAYGENVHWKGLFQGIDVSFAETQKDINDNPVDVKVYWSERTDAGSLQSDSSWVEYNEATVDKTKVHSLAFQYLDQNGNPAILPQFSFSYVLVKMKSPSDPSIHSFAYNNFHSEWNALDNISGEVIPSITGINSNTVAVYMDETFDLDVNIIWDDYENVYNYRPNKVYIDLYKNGSLVETRELNITAGENHVVFPGLLTTEQSMYTVVQRDINLYESESDFNGQSLSYTFTNIYRYTFNLLTGINTDILPYIVLLTVGAAGLGFGLFWFGKKKVSLTKD